MAAGFKGLQEAAGVWLAQSPPGGPGFIGIQHAMGVWIWGATTAAGAPTSVDSIYIPHYRPRRR